MDEGTLYQIKRGGLVDQVVERLTDAIVSGRLAPGEKLVESQVGVQLGVSRGPVREAIRRLEQMGVVEKIPYRGTFVSTLTVRDVEELHDLRAPMEGLAAARVARRAEPEAVRELEAIVGQMRKAPPETERSRLVELDTGFHDALIALSDHRLLQELWSQIAVRLHTFLLLKPHRLYSTPAEAAALHDPIVAAIAAGDERRAEQAARQHVVEAGEEHVRSWREVAGEAEED